MSNKKYTLQEVKSAAEKQAWLDFPKKGLYKAYPNWVCPLDTDIEKVFDPKRNELLHEGEAIRWVVCNEKGQIVTYAKARGRRKAIEALARRYDEQVVDAGSQIVGIAHADCVDYAL
jgi:hypothetical protein